MEYAKIQEGHTLSFIYTRNNSARLRVVEVQEVKPACIKCYDLEKYCHRCFRKDRMSYINHIADSDEEVDIKRVDNPEELVYCYYDENLKSIVTVREKGEQLDTVA